jgi:predicted nucleotidyltransferase component of viral defense system
VIPKAEVLAVAEQSGLLATAIEKDYVLGWVLFAIAQHPELSAWIFKGGTCLKKCYFDTYRFRGSRLHTAGRLAPRRHR